MNFARLMDLAVHAAVRGAQLHESETDRQSGRPKLAILAPLKETFPGIELGSVDGFQVSNNMCCLFPFAAVTEVILLPRQ